MSVSESHKAPEDLKNVNREAFDRYCIQDGQSSIHGDTNYEIQTQEGQSFGFYADKGEGRNDAGEPGTGNAVLYTQGCSDECLGEGIKVRKPGDIQPIYAKKILCKRGDLLIDCLNGDVTIRARNINLHANGGGQDGQLTMEACRVAQIKSPDIRFQGEKILMNATTSANIISRGFFELKYGFALAASHADLKYGVMSEVLKAATTISSPKID